MPARRPRVAIVYKWLPQWRRRFFELLRDRLDELGVDFVLIYGQADPVEALKRDKVNLAWAHKIQNRIMSVGARELYWQPCLGLLKGVDLVIVEQASKLLVNYLLLIQSVLGIRKLAFWGHGRNFQVHTANHLAEVVKRIVSRRVHWWFAYNTLSANAVREIGFPSERISVVQNAIDTRHLAAVRSRVTAESLESLRQELGLRSNNVAIYSGSMYAAKRLDFLLDACRLIRCAVPDFEIIFIGAGPDDKIVKDAEQLYGWVHYVGPRFDEKKVPYFMLSKLSLMPGLVGLGVLDAFAMEVPLVTTNVPYHSPEIEYLTSGVNGMVVEPFDDVGAYAREVVALLRDSASRRLLVEGCKDSAGRYTVEEMVERFAGGICLALGRSDAVALR